MLQKTGSEGLRLRSTARAMKPILWRALTSRSGCNPPACSKASTPAGPGSLPRGGARRRNVRHAQARRGGGGGRTSEDVTRADADPVGLVVADAVELDRPSRRDLHHDPVLADDVELGLEDERLAARLAEDAAAGRETLRALHDPLVVRTGHARATASRSCSAVEASAAPRNPPPPIAAPGPAPVNCSCHPYSPHHHC